jgi:uncharacterized protein
MNANRLILAGGSGFLGQALARHFSERGWAVTVLTRSPQAPLRGIRYARWDGEMPGEWGRELEGAMAVVNLAGRSVDCRYTARNRREIIESRLKPTRVIGEAIARCQSPPRVWLNASTATIYKHTFGPAWDESGETGAHPDAKDAFSIEVAIAWEKAFFDSPVPPATRKVAMRTAMVLGHGRNSVFPVLRRLTRLGLGGRMGSGRQFVSWIHELDFCRALEWIIEHEALSGVVNVAAPNPLSNAEMMRLFRELAGMPFGLPATEWMLELGAFFLRTETELIIKSLRVVPGRLLADGFDFQWPELRPALQDLQRAE